VGEIHGGYKVFWEQIAYVADPVGFSFPLPFSLLFLFPSFLSLFFGEIEFWALGWVYDCGFGIGLT
jgi:hypothetical protein